MIKSYRFFVAQKHSEHDVILNLCNVFGRKIRECKVIHIMREKVVYIVVFVLLRPSWLHINEFMSCIGPPLSFMNTDVFVLHTKTNYIRIRLTRAYNWFTDRSLAVVTVTPTYRIWRIRGSLRVIDHRLFIDQSNIRHRSRQTVTPMVASTVVLKFLTLCQLCINES